MGRWRIRLQLRRQRGAVLLLTVWATATLTGVVVLQATRVALQLRWAERVGEARQARYLALAGISAAESRISSDDNLTIDSLNEVWAQFPADAVPWEGGNFRWTVADEQARIPINTASIEILNRLPGFTAQASDELVRRRAEGKSLAHLEELQTLPGPGFSSNSLEELAILTTTHGSGPVNLNTASQQVLAILGLSADLAQQIEQFRAGPDGIVGTQDDGAFPQASADEVEARLREFLGAGFTLTPGDRAALELLAGQSPPMLDVKSSLFHIEASGETLRHAIQRKVVAVLDRSGAVRGWNEG